MKSLFALILLVSTSSQAVMPNFKSKTAVASNQIKFVYEPFEGGTSLNCAHGIANTNNPYDHLVQCSENGIVKYQFTVHLAVSRYTHPTAPRMSIELLYWVNSEGATSWFHFDQEARLMQVESSQSLPGATAGLRMILKL